MFDQIHIDGELAQNRFGYRQPSLREYLQRTQLVGDSLYCGRSVNHGNALPLEVSHYGQRKVAGLTAGSGNDDIGLFELPALIERRPALGGINNEIELLRPQHVELDTHPPCNFGETTDFRRLWYVGG